MSAAPTAVTMYTTSWCGYCFRLKKMMQREGIEFAEVDIEADEQGRGPRDAGQRRQPDRPHPRLPRRVALTNPSIDQVKKQLAALPGA